MPEGQENIPHLLRELIPQATFFTQVVNHGILGHYVATASLATGVYETFNNFDAKNWAATVKQLDEVMTAWEKAVEQADDAKLSTWASTIAHVGTHNAYHVGQIIVVRKQQGAWDPANGVK